MTLPTGMITKDFQFADTHLRHLKYGVVFLNNYFYIQYTSNVNAITQADITFQ